MIVKIVSKKIRYEFLDCKQDHDHELMKSAPSILDFLNDFSKHYFEKLQQYLTAIRYSI